MAQCIKRRLLFAAAQTYPQPTRDPEWTTPPVAVERDLIVAGQKVADRIDSALVGRMAEGVVIAFRGTLPPTVANITAGARSFFDWANDGWCIAAPDGAYAGKVHAGFAGSVDRLWEDDLKRGPGIGAHLRRLLADGGPERIFVTGHSKGGALANLGAMRARRQWPDLPPPKVLTIAAARAGDKDFAKAYAAARIDCLAYEGAYDLVPLLPPGGQAPAQLLDALGRLRVPVTAAPFGYVRVGSRRFHSESLPQFWADVWLRLRIRIPVMSFPEQAVTALACAHLIDSGSQYFNYICDGEGCDHSWARR